MTGDVMGVEEKPIVADDREISGTFALEHDLDLTELLTRFLEVGPVGVQIWHCPSEDPGEAVPVYTNQAGYAAGAPQPTPQHRTMRDLIPHAMQPLPGADDGLADLVWRAAVLDEPGHLPRIGTGQDVARIFDLRFIPLGGRCCAIAARDVSAEVNAVGQMRESTQELIDALDEGQEHTQAVVHDLKTPLTAIIGYADLVAELAKRGDGRVESIADRLVETAHRTLQMVQSLLERPVVDHLVDLDDVVADVLDIVRPSLDEIGGSIHVDGLPRVLGSRTGYRHMVQNLLTNSIRCRSTERPLEITVSADRHGDAWRLEFADNGIGIAPDRREQVFEPGIRLEPAPGDNGSGLGLSLCRTLVERFGGEIWVGDTPPEQGTTMIVELPVAHEVVEV